MVNWMIWFYWFIDSLLDIFDDLVMFMDADKKIDFACRNLYR